MGRLVSGFVVGLLVVIVFGVVPSPAAAVTCPPANGHVWFLGVVYDANEDPPRDDFVKDLDNFLFFLNKLRTVYCIPDAQAKIYAFRGGFSYQGVTYEAATEANVKSKLGEFGAAASAFSDSIFFYFHSSHGLFRVTGTCPGGGLRAAGSFAGLGGGGGQDGSFTDCELGSALNGNFAANVRIVTMVDCSFCGGFSDSLTAVSGTVDDDGPGTSGIPKANRIAITGCAVTTECFGSEGGGVSFWNMRRAMEFGLNSVDGFTAPGFPTVQGFDVPVRNNQLNAPDGRGTVSEVFFAAVSLALTNPLGIGVEEQFRIKYGFSSIGQDIQMM